MGKWLPDGTIEYLGRIDDQVKIRGIPDRVGRDGERIKPRAVIGVNQAVVLAKADQGGNKRLVGCVLIVPQKVFDKRSHRLTHLEFETARLYGTGHMGSAGKPAVNAKRKDRQSRALPDPELTDMAAVYVAPRNETEAKLVANLRSNCQAWSRLVGTYDNFFELGGHSLLAMRVVSYIEGELLVSISIHTLFRFTCISDLSEYLEFEMQANDKSKENDNDEFDELEI